MAVLNSRLVVVEGFSIMVVVAGVVVVLTGAAVVVSGAGAGVGAAIAELPAMLSFSFMARSRGHLPPQLPLKSSRSMAQTKPPPRPSSFTRSI